jgi:RNA polymerase sigma-70 factor (ECF subfamily)
MLLEPRGKPAAIPYGPPEDRAAFWAGLARRIMARDAEAEAEFAAHFYLRVRSLATARLHGSDAALDIAQETIVAVLQALRAGQLGDLEKLPAFVLGTATNLINNHHRKQARSREVGGDPPDLPGGVDPSQAVLAAEQDALIREALGRLNALDQRILLLTLVEGLNPREIAPIVGLTPKAVRSHKSRAVEAVADEIESRGRTRRRDHIRKSGPAV